MPDETAMATNGSTSSYLFDVEDLPSNIVLENGQMKLATIEKVVERVTSEKFFDPNFLQVFLLTYRQFITPKQLIDLLTARYNMPEPEGMTKDELENFRKYIETPVRLRIYNAVKHWISRHWVDFEENTEMIKSLNEFSNLLANTKQEKESENLNKILTKMVEDKQKNIVFMFDKQPPKPIPMAKSRKTDHIPLLQIHPEEAARQLTLIEYDLFKAIKSWEFLNQGWTKKDKATRAPGIVAMTKRFNEVSKWVATEIVSEKDKKARVLLLNRLIEVAERCKNLNNLNAMTSIIAGLQSSSIYRLKGLWPELPSKQLDIFEEMVELISSKQSYKNFREYLRRCEPPCIPYLGVYLTDLTFIEDGNPNLVNGMLNLNKCRSISKVILEIQQYQQTPYCLEPVAVVQQYLNTLKFLEEDQCYKLSLQIEARSTSSGPTSPPPASGPGRTGSTSGNAPTVTANGAVMSGGSNIDSMELRIRLPGAKLPIEVPINILPN